MARETSYFVQAFERRQGRKPESRRLLQPGTGGASTAEDCFRHGVVAFDRRRATRADKRAPPERDAPVALDSRRPQ